MIIGRPLAGKSRAMYQAIAESGLAADITLIRNADIDPSTHFFPLQWRAWRRQIVIIDDLHRFVELENFQLVFRYCAERDIPIVATCRSGTEFEKTKGIMTNNDLYVGSIFGDAIVQVGAVSEEEAKRIAADTGHDWNFVSFDGTIGSIFMELAEMECRFTGCNSTQKTILQALRKLYICGVFRGDKVFPVKWVKALAESRDLCEPAYKWDTVLQELESMEFLNREGDCVRAEEAYLESVVRPATSQPIVEQYEEVLQAVSEYPDALRMLARRISEKRTVMDADSERYGRLFVQLHHHAQEGKLIEPWLASSGMGRDFYSNVLVLDMARLMESPSSDVVEIVVDVLQDPVLLRYFFRDMDNPAWLKPLKDAGAFANPPQAEEVEPGLYRVPGWEASRYLVRVADKVDPNLIVEIAFGLDTDNYHALSDLVAAARKIDAEAAAIMLPLFIKWLNSHFRPTLLGIGLVELLPHLAKGGHWDACEDASYGTYEAKLGQAMHLPVRIFLAVSHRRLICIGSNN